MSQGMIMSLNPMLSTSAQSAAAAGTSKRKAADTNGTTTAGSSTGTSSTDSIGSTFLSLLVQELQNQDPTAPMDSTQMVGQMISLNQLDQLTSINQTLTGAYGGANSSTTSPGATAGASTNTTGSASGQIATSPATAAALRLLRSSGVTTHPAVSPSVTLPAL